MSDWSGGPGWWLAADGKWYPPHLLPGAVLPPPPPAVPPGVTVPGTPGPRPGAWWREPGRTPTASFPPDRLLRRSGAVLWSVTAVVVGLIVLVVVLPPPLATYPSVAPPPSAPRPVPGNEPTLAVLSFAVDQAFYQWNPESHPGEAGLAAQLERLQGGDGLVAVTYRPGPVSAPGVVSVDVSPDERVVVFASRSSAGRCFFAESNREPSMVSTAGWVDPEPGIHFAEATGASPSCSSGGVGTGPGRTLQWDATWGVP